MDPISTQMTRPLTIYSYDDLAGGPTKIEAGYVDLAGQDYVTVQMMYVVNDSGQTLQEIDPQGKIRAFTYDANGNVETTIDPKGQVTEFEWYFGHRLTRRTVGQPSLSTVWLRNDLGQVTEVQQPIGTALYTYGYDAAHRLSGVTDTRGNKTLTYDWSPGGRLNFVLDAEGAQTDYVYDGVGRLANIWAPTGEAITFAYDSGGRMIEKMYPNGVRSRFTYNPDGSLAELVNAATGSVISQHAYTYDAFGNRETHLETIGGTTTPYRYAYDPLNRLVEVKHATTQAVLESYGYDPLGNRTRKTDAAGTVIAFLYDASNQLTEARQGSTTGPLAMGFVYDLNGNLTKKCEGGTVTRTEMTCSGTTVTDLTYDALNRTNQVMKTGLAAQTYAYDDRGRRIQKSVGGAVTNYVYNGEDIHATYGGLWDTAAARYTHGPNTDDPVLKVAGSATQYFHSDGLGSIVSLSNPAATIDATAKYDAWGNRTNSAGTLPIYGYTGREPDETGLIYYRARYYDPVVGRFTQRDPIGPSGGLNLYAYVAGNPINRADPLGLLPWNRSVQALDPATAAMSVTDDAGVQASSFGPAAQRMPAMTPADEETGGDRSCTNCQLRGVAPPSPRSALIDEGLAKLESTKVATTEGGRAIVSHLKMLNDLGWIRVGKISPQGFDGAWDIQNNMVWISKTANPASIPGILAHEGFHATFGEGISSLSGEYGAYQIENAVNRELGVLDYPRSPAWIRAIHGGVVRVPY